MREKNIRVDYDTIGTIEQKNLIEATRNLAKAMTTEEYFSIMLICQRVVERLTAEAEKQGIEI